MNSDIATHFAPEIHQLVQDKLINSADQGSETNAAGNCFTESLPNSIALDDNANSFDYFYYDQGDACQVPIAENDNFPFISLATEDFEARCTEGIGSGLNDPNGTGGDPTSEGPPSGDPTLYTCPSCIKDSIQIWIDVIIQTGGDDPTTSNEDPVNPAPVGTEGPVSTSENAEIMLDQWVNYALFVAIDSENYTFGEEVLSMLSDWKWSIKLYGLALLEKDYTKASGILNTLPQDNAEQIAFGTVQNVNIKRLMQATLDDPYIPTEIEKSDLFDIGSSDHICSGYARGLYKVLTGIIIPAYIKTPSPKNATTPRSASELITDLSIFPNPLNGSLNLGNLDADRVYSYKVIDLVGMSLLSGTIDKSETTTIDVSSLELGLYHIVLLLDDEQTEVIRFVIQ